MNFDKSFIYNCLKNDLETNSNIKVLESLSVDFQREELTGILKVEHLSKENLGTTICDYLKSKEFNFLVRYGLLSYDVNINSENDFSLEISPDGHTPLEDITIEELISEELNFFFYDNLLKSKDNITSFSDFKSVIDALFGISILPKGKAKTYSFFVTGLELTKDNMMKIKENNDQVPGVESITFIDCVQVDKDFLSKYFEKSTVINYK